MDLTPAGRGARLQARCGADPELLRQVQSLVAAYDHVTTVLGRLDLSAPSAPPPAVPAEPPPVPSHPRYRITGELGRGGMGLVYLATDLQLDRPVALKFLHTSFGADPEARARLLAEARAAAMLDHPNVATVHDVGQSDDGRLFIAMAHCPGESLRARLERGALRPEEGVRIAIQVAEGLAAAHARGLVHRDIKPANLLFAGGDLVKIVDFGIAERQDPDCTAAAAVAGTMAYMSPEQASGAAVDARTDLWSLGVVLFEMLTGHRPFAGSNALTLLHAILHERPARLPDGIPSRERLQPVLDRALAKEPAGRYATAREMLADLRRALAPDSRVPASALPAYLTSFVGRERELQAAREAVRTARLVTLTGAPGTGKTRLAVQLASELRPHFPDGQVLVPLAAVEDPLLVPSAIAQALAVRTTGDGPVLEAVKQHLADKRLLLVLDNFEQVLAAAPRVIELLSGCQLVTVLVTSRASLRVAGEREFPVPPLDCPAPAEEASPQTIAASEAVALFAERAAAILPGFTVDEQNAATVAELCRRLDGLPLAIELAAARVKVLPPKAILSRLENRLELLKGGARDSPSRHQTLRQAIAWSYGLLAAPEKKLLRAVAVFTGGFTLDAVERVAAERAGVDAVEGLGVLLDNNLLYQDSTRDGEPRFAMLETIREFSLECLRAAGEEAEARRAHCDYCLQLAEGIAADLTGPHQAECLERLEQEHDNLRAALDWALLTGTSEIAARIAAAAWRFWLVRGHLLEGAEALRRVLTATRDVSTRRLSLLTAAGTLAHNVGDYAAARRYYEEAVGMARALGDERAVAGALNNLGWAAWRQGDYAAARTLSLESLALHRAAADGSGAAHALTNLGWVDHHEGSYATAEARHREALAIREAAGDTRGIGFSLVNLAWALLRQGRTAEAGELLGRAHTLLHAVGERQLVAFAGVIAARYHRAAGDPGRALSLLNESIATFRRIGDRYGLAAALAIAALAEADAGRAPQAGAVASESLQLRRQIGDRWGEAESLQILGMVAGAPRTAETLPLYAQALVVWESLGDRASLAECLELAASAAAANDALTAALLAGAAAGLRDSCGLPSASQPFRPAQPALADAYAAGAAMPLRQVLARVAALARTEPADGA